jgi:NADH:ubiquinone oxidoreductase subunit 6 (subunit J)
MRSQEFIALGSALVVLGIVFSEDWLIGYSFIGAGVLLSIISAIRLGRKPRTQNNRTGGV